MSSWMITSIALLHLLAPLAWASQPSLKGKQLAAIHTQEQSIQKMKKFLKEHPGDSREPEFLYRLSDLYFEKSGISFQYTEGESVKTHKKFYEQSLTQGIETLSLMIRKYPAHVSIPDAYFKRGKAYKELKKVGFSRADYLKLLSNYPNYARIDSALMDLGDYAQDDNHHEEALRYYLQIEKNPSSQYYTLALHRAGWSYFNLAQFKTAIQYLKKEILTYQERKGEVPYLETAYQDLALFYFEGINKKTDDMNVKAAVSLIEDLSEGQVDTQKRPFFGTTVLRFSKLLKAYNLTSDLDQLKNLLIKSYDQLPETMEVAMLVFEYHYEKHEYAKLIHILNDANDVRVNLKSPAVDEKFTALVTKSLKGLNDLVLKNKKSTELDQLFIPLVEITEFMNEHLVLEGTNALALYSLAETSFATARYTSATKYYLKLLNSAELPEKIKKSDLMVRIASSRYQELKTKKLIQEQLKAVAIDSGSAKLSSADETLIREWFEWVFSSDALKSEDSIAFQLEAIKMQYHYFEREEAVKKLTEFALNHAGTEESRVAASLALDTYAASQNWVAVYEFGRKISEHKNWKNAEFVEKVREMSADSHLKTTLATNDAQTMLDRSEECLEQFKNPSITFKCKMIQGKTLVALKQYSDGEKVLTDLSTHHKLNAEDLKSVTLLKVEVYQKQGKLVLATHELEKYAELTQFKELEMVHHIIQLYWFQRNMKKVKPLLANEKICSSLPKNLCEQYHAAQGIRDPYTPASYSHGFKNMMRASKSAAPLWAIGLLEQPQKVNFQDRLVILQKIANNWENVDPFLQIQFLDVLKTRVEATVESVRISAAKIGKLSSDPATIERRIRILQGVDKAFAKVMGLNWIEIKIKTMHELQLVYEELVADLRKIETPENLLEPFVKKQEQLTGASNELFTMSATVKMQSPKSVLLGSDVRDKVPSTYWEEWKSGVESERPDYLYYLISLRGQDDYSQLLRGLVLISIPAPSEGFELIRSAPSSSWKNSLISKFEMKGAAQ